MTFECLMTMVHAQLPIFNVRNQYAFYLNANALFRKVIIPHKRTGYNANVMRQSACLVINQITVDNFAALFNCTPMDRASDSMMVPT